MKQGQLNVDNITKSRRTHNEKGFTLIEVLVSIVIVGVSLAVMATLLAASLRGGQNTKHTTAAVTLMQDKIEEIKNSSYASIASGSEADIDSEGNAGGKYDRNWTVTTTGNTKEIAVTVNWVSNGVTKSKSLTTIISE